MHLKESYDLLKFKNVIQQLQYYSVFIIKY